MTMDLLISKFQPISLSEMGGIKLMNRTDTKFVTSIDKLMQLLQMAGDEYRVQEIDGKRNMSYATIYYDSEDYAFYNAHHDGHAGRQKVRVRSYVDSHPISKHHKLKLYYRYQNLRQNDDDALDIHVLGIGYSYQF